MPSGNTVADQHVTLGVRHAAAGDYLAAFEAFSTALRTDPNNLAAVANLSDLWLLTGHIKEGLKHRTLRHLGKPRNSLYFQSGLPLWDGANHAGKPIWVWNEHGIGDQIIYASMLPELAARKIAYQLECNWRLVPLFERSFGADRFVAQRKHRPAFQTTDGLGAHLPALDLALLFRPTLDSFPAAHPYLLPDQTHARQLRESYGTAEPLIGISWKSKTPGQGPRKSTEILAWRAVLTTPGVRFVSLQYGDVEAELAAIRDQLGVNIIADQTVDSARDLDAFAAQVAAMDLVISTSNTTVHMAGALGVPTWTLLTSGGGLIWYWFTGRNDSPWYPGMRLFRKPPGGDWPPLLADIAARLRTELPTLPRSELTRTAPRDRQD